MATPRVLLCEKGTFIVRMREIFLRLSFVNEGVVVDLQQLVDKRQQIYKHES